MMNNFNIIYFRIFGELTRILNIMKDLYKYISYIWQKTKKSNFMIEKDWYKTSFNSESIT